MRFLALILLAGAAHAQQWERIDGNEHAAIYLDTASVRRDGQYIEAQSLLSYSAPRMGPSGAFSSQANLDRFDCARRKMATKAIRLYSDNQGKALLSESVMAGPGAEFRIPPPRSLVDSVYRRLCRTT